MKAVFRPGQPSVFSGGVFEGIFVLPTDYPWKPPKFNFTTEVLNPGVGERGQVCCCTVQILGRDWWSPSVTIWKMAKVIGQKIFFDYAACECGTYSLSVLAKKNPAKFQWVLKDWMKKNFLTGLSSFPPFTTERFTTRHPSCLKGSPPLNW